jgi:hypothetical protein
MVLVEADAGGEWLVACFVLWREISRCAFWDFCNNICQKPTFERAFAGVADAFWPAYS